MNCRGIKDKSKGREESLVKEKAEGMSLAASPRFQLFALYKDAEFILSS